jgi:hypothetical protein
MQPFSVKLCAIWETFAQWEDWDGKRTKVPQSVKNGKASGTSAKWAHTWGSYLHAKMHFKPADHDTIHD